MAVDAHGGQEIGCGFLPPPTTNNRAEMHAQIEALEWLFENYGPCELEVVSDSQYVIFGCQDPDRKRNVNNDLWDSLDDAIDTHNWVQWRHVKGHVGIELNELCDQLAVKARKEARWQPQ